LTVSGAGAESTRNRPSSLWQHRTQSAAAVNVADPAMRP
jgi:hypothetical protein